MSEITGGPGYGTVPTSPFGTGGGGSPGSGGDPPGFSSEVHGLARYYLYVLDRTDYSLQGVVEAFTTFEHVRRLFEAGGFKLALAEVQEYTPLEKGRLLLVPWTGRVYMIEQVLRSDPETTMDVEGRDVGGMLGERIVYSPGFDHDVVSGDPAETAIKHYVDTYAGPSAPLARRIPGMVIAPDEERGADVHYEARFQTVLEVIGDLGRDQGMGWEITFDLETEVFTFDVIEPDDVSPEVYLDLEFDSINGMTWLSSDLGAKDWALVAGQGEGSLRVMEEVFVGEVEPSGWSRHEVFVDANDIDEAHPEALVQRGLAKLLETLTEDAYEVAANAFSDFVFGRDYNLGSVVSVRHRSWGVLGTSQVIGAVGSIDTGKAGGAETVTIEMGRLIPRAPRTRPFDNGSARK